MERRLSLTLVLIEAVVGHSALEGTDAAQLFIAAADTTRRPTLRAHGVDPGDAVEAVLTLALTVDPKGRYPNARVFWDALQAAVAHSGEAANVAAAPRSGAASASFSSTSATRAEGAGAPISGTASFGALPGSATELTASTPLPGQPPQTRASGRGRMLVSASMLVVAIGATAGIWLGRAKSFTPEAVSSSGTGVSASAPNTEQAAALPPSQASSAASTAVAAVAKSRGFAGLPARDVPAGQVSTNGAWLDKFSILRREDSQGLGYGQAFARCTDAGKTLCSEEQWQRACDSFPEVGEAASWTESLEDGHAVVRGGGSCAPRKLIAQTDQDAERVGLCCDRAVAMTSASLQKPFLSSTAGVVLKLERALNQRSIDGFLDLSEDRVVLNQKPRDKGSLKTLLTQSFAGSRDLVIVNDSCDVSVEAKKIIVKRSRRVKKTSYETTGWTAVCQQTRHRDGKALSAKSRYEFSASSKLRALTDTEAPAPAE